MITKNPEFVRNLWLQISPVRLIAAVGVLAVVVAVVFVSVTNKYWEALIHIADTALVFVLIIWGAVTAGTTLREEVRSNTWNQQRMSGMTPWQITWGKLLGGTAYIWWISAWLLVLLIVARTASNDAQNLPYQIAAWVAAGIAIHAVAMIAALGFRSPDGSQIEEVSFVAWALPVIALPQVFGTLLLDEEATALWFGLEYSSAFLTLVCVLPAMFWAVVGAYRTIRREMQEPLMPWALPACVLTFGFLLAGFEVGRAVGSVLHRGFVNSLILTALLTWAAFLVEPHSINNLVDCIAKLRKGQVRDAALQLSTSTVLLAFLLLLSPLCALLSFASSSTEFSGNEKSLIGLLSKASPWIYLSIMIVAVRDFLVAHALQRISKTSRRAMGAFVVYLGIMYVAVPLALSGAFDQHAVNWWLPMSGKNEVSGAAGLVGPLLTLGAVIALCIRFFGRRDGVESPAEI